MPRRLVVAALVVAVAGVTAQNRPRSRDLDIAPGAGQPGKLNAIEELKTLLARRL